MRQFLLYEPSNGTVKGSVSGSVIDMFEASHAAQGMVLLEIPREADPFAYYVDLQTNEAKLRQPMPAVLEGLTLSGLPVPCTIVIDDTAYSCDDATVTLEFDQPGRYSVTVTAVPYLDAHFEVDYEA